MKIDWNNLNIQPMPNPKPLKVQRVDVRISHVDENGNALRHTDSTGFIRNANVHPAALTRRG